LAQGGDLKKKGKERWGLSCVVDQGGCPNQGSGKIRMLLGGKQPPSGEKVFEGRKGGEICFSVEEVWEGWLKKKGSNLYGGGGGGRVREQRRRWCQAKDRGTSYPRATKTKCPKERHLWESKKLKNRGRGRGSVGPLTGNDLREFKVGCFCNKNRTPNVLAKGEGGNRRGRKKGGPPGCSYTGNTLRKTLLGGGSKTKKVQKEEIHTRHPSFGKKSGSHPGNAR